MLRTGTHKARRTRLARAVLALVAVASYVLPAAWIGSPARAAEPGMRVIGTMPFEDAEAAPFTPPNYPLLVDPALHIGIRESTGTTSVQLFDLDSLTLLASVPVPVGFGNASNAQFAVDDTHHRVFFAEDPLDNSCASELHILDIVNRSWTSKKLPCYEPGPGVPLGFAATGISYFAPADKLYLMGYSTAEWSVQHQINGLSVKETSIIRQVDAETLQLDWSVDASSVCDWHEVPNLLGGGVSSRIQRVGDNVYSFCLQGGPNQNGTGGRGESLVVPLADGAPVMNGSNPMFITFPTYTDSTVGPYIDPATGRLLLTSSGLPFGPGVWVFDPLKGRFFGVIPTGISSTAQDDFYTGTDAQTGRIYFHDSRGFVVADTRHNPLPGGVSHPVLTEAPQQSGPQGEGSLLRTWMFVDGNSHRLFVPDPQRGAYVVVEDLSPPAPDNPPPDPDAGTADIAEVPGLTANAFAGGGTAFGARALVVGGTTSLVHQADLASDCHGPGPLSGSCLSDSASAPGNRDFRLAETEVQLGSTGGASAFATAGHSAPSDRATDADVRAAGHCENDQIGPLAESAAPGVYPSAAAAGLCHTPTPVESAEQGGPLEGITFENMQQGTQQGNDNQGFPIPSSICTDFGDGATQDGNDRPSNQLGTSAVACDATNSVTTAHSEASAASLPTNGASPLVSVALAVSDVNTRMTDQGIVTTVTSSAEGITLGGVLSIGRVVTVAETAAHGQTGTSAATFTFTIADVHGPGIDCGTCTASDVADAINRVFAGRIEARVPSVLSLASPHGFTGLVTKDPLLQDSDRALNDDDSIAVDGLDLVVVNDYQAQRIDVDPATGAPQSSDVSARSRLLLEFAGVQSESHYGIFPLPQDVAPGSGPGLAGLLGGATGGGRAGAAVLPGSNLPLSAANVAPRTASPSGGPTFLNPVAAFWDAVRLVITRPGEAAVLACLWTLFAAPLYLTLRRRNLAQALAYGTGTRS